MEASGNSARPDIFYQGPPESTSAIQHASHSRLASVTSVRNSPVQPAGCDKTLFQSSATPTTEELFDFLAQEMNKPEGHRSGNLKRIENISICCKTIAHCISRSGEKRESATLAFYQRLESYLRHNSSRAGEWIPYLVRYIGAPPDKMLNKMTDSVFSRTGSLMGAGIYLHSLAVDLSADKPERLVKVLNNKSLHKFNIAELFHSLVDKIHLQFWNAPFDCETTQEKLKNYFELFMAVINRSDASEIVKHFAYDSLRPLQVCTRYNLLEDVYQPAVSHFRKKATDVRNLRSAQLTLNDDNLFTLVTCLSYPPRWGEPLAQRFREVIAQLGPDGNIPIATLYFFNYANRAVSIEYCMTSFRQLFKVNIKAVNFVRAMTILFISECISYREAVRIYNSADKVATANFRCWWQRYQSIRGEYINENTCLAISKQGVAVKPRAYWDEFVPGRSGTDFVLPAETAGKWLDKCRQLEKIIFSDEDFHLLLVVVLTSLPADKESVTAMAEKIIAASHAKAKLLNARLQKMVEEHKSEYPALIYIVAALQIALLAQEDGKNAKEIIINIINNLAAIGLAFQLQDALSRLTRVDLSLESYLLIISQVLIKSRQLKSDPQGEILRSLIEKNCDVWLTTQQLDYLFSDDASLQPEILSLTAVKKIFTERIRRQLLAESTAPLLAGERQALAKLLLARAEGWEIFSACCGALLAADPEAPLDLSWAWNASLFPQASLPVMILMLQFPAKVLATPPDEFIHQCLENIKLNADREKSLVALCRFLQQQERPATFTQIITTTIELCEQHGTSGRLSEAIRRLQSDINAALYPQASQTLSGYLASLVAAVPPSLTEQQTFNVDASALEIIEIRTRARKLRDAELPLPASENITLTAALKENPTQSRIKIYSHAPPAQLHQDAAMNQALHEGLKLLMLDGKLHELNFHHYKNEGEKTVFCTFIIKPQNLAATDGKLSGAPNARGMLLQGSNNRYIVLGAENHKRVKKLSRSYLSYSESDVDAMIASADSLYRRLEFNPQTEALELVEQPEQATP